MKYTFLEFILDTNKKELFANNEILELTKRQYDLLLFLVKNPQIMFSKHELIEKVWAGRHVTENSIDQSISKVRKVLNSVKKDTYIKTEYGKGLMFVPEVNLVQKPVTSYYKHIAIAAIILVAIVVWMNIPGPSQTTTPRAKLDQAEKLIILPMKFSDKSISEIEQQGMNSLLQSTFNLLDSEDKTIFDDTSKTTQQAIEKHFKIEKDLLVVQSNITKKDNVYHAIIKLSNGIDTIKQTSITADNLNDLVNNQITIISGYNININQKDLKKVINSTPDQQYIQALGYQKQGDNDKAIEMLKQVLSKQEEHFQARLRLANIYIEEKKYAQSLSELNTLKATPAYEMIATEVELAYAQIKFNDQDYQALVSDLVSFQANHLTINDIKKAKIQLQIGFAYVALGKGAKAMKAFKIALINIDKNRHPLIYAKSYYGQGSVLITQEINDEVFDLFEKARKYAKNANNLHYQIVSLNSISSIYLSRFKWEKSIQTVEQLIELAELDNDNENYANGLSNLVAILNQRGHFTRARELNNKLEVLANKTGSDETMLLYLFFDAVIAMNFFEWEHAQMQIDRNYQIALDSKNYSLLLNNAFLTLELKLLKDDLDDFKEIWDERVAFINERGFERVQVYMDYYLARYYKQTNKINKAKEILQQVTNQATLNNDMKMLVDAQNQLAQIYLETDAKKSLEILNALEKHNPHPNPYLEIKAQALNRLGKKIQALSVLNQAKLVFSESWTAKNEAFYQSLKNP